MLSTTCKCQESSRLTSNTYPDVDTTRNVGDVTNTEIKLNILMLSLSKP